SKDEVEKMKKEAEVHASDDKKRRELVDMKNQADSVVYQTEKMLKEQGEKVPADVKKTVEEKLEEVKKTKDGEDAEAIKKAMDDLQQAAIKIGEAIYKGQSAPTQGSGPSAEDQKAGDNKSGPVEGEVEDVKK
ncbi:MAG: Hsp70 family protein, partial [Patescibacteria group bacterium]